MIHVCFGLHDKDGNYSKFTGTAMLSMFENTSTKITVHILHDNTLTLDNRDKFSYIAGRYGQIIKFYNVERTCAAEIEELKSKIPAINSARVSIGALYRIFTTEVLPKEIERVIYIDSDMIVNLDINDLWQVSLGDKPIAAIPESEADSIFFKVISRSHYLINEKIVSYENYFNSAVMLMNLNRLRSERKTLMQGVKWRMNHPQCICFDQDILNYCFGNDYVCLPNRFDRFVTSERAAKRPVQKFIYHFTGSNPTMNFNDDLNRLYFQYFEKTPWFSKDVIGIMDMGLRQLDMGLKNIAIQLSVIMAGKERAFFATVPNITPLKNMFFIRNDEEIIPFENPESFNVLVNSMKNSLGKKIFFLMFPEGYQQLRASLMQAGFVEGRDFINAAMFLSEAHGVPLNTYELIKVM